MVHILLKPDFENFEHYFTSVWNECNCAVVWTFFGTAFLWNGMKTNIFQSCVHCWVFQICWHIQWSTFTASSFRICNSSTGSPSPPLGLFILMLPKAYLTSHSRMSGSRWVITHTTVVIWVMKIFFVQFCVFLPPLLSIFCSLRPIQFLSCIMPIFVWNVPLVSLIFLKRSLVFPILLFSSISLHWSLNNEQLRKQLLGGVYGHCSFVMLKPRWGGNLNGCYQDVLPISL